MLRHFEQTRPQSQALRLAAVLVATLLTAISARITIETGGPVPFTLQVLTVLLAGMVLGARDGALSQMVYVGLIASGAPLDARALGPAALTGPTAGFLFGFIPAAFVAGWLVEQGLNRWWMRWLAGLAGVAVIYLLGATYLKYSAALSWQAAWTAGVAPFIALDTVKALLAALMTEGGRQLLAHTLDEGLPGA